MELDKFKIVIYCNNSNSEQILHYTNLYAQNIHQLNYLNFKIIKLKYYWRDFFQQL